jgi:hypothetical protein
MANSTDDFEDAILQAISEDAELRAKLDLIPEAIEATVVELMPVDTGEAKLSVEVKHRRSEWKKLSTRATKIGEIYSDDEPGKIQTLEFGRGEDDKHGATPEFAPFRRAAARWFDHEIRL